MRTIVRVGGLVGGIAFIVLYAAQTRIALAVVPGVTLAGLCAGLCTAKWLEREWYGRQFNAGLRAGAIASVIASLGALLSLLFLGPRDLETLAARSHLARLDFAPVAHAFGFIGASGADVLAVELAALTGAVLAAVTCQIFAWSKSAHAVKVVAQARLAAQSLNRDEIYRATGAPSTYGVTGAPSAYGAAAHPSNLLPQFGASIPGAASMPSMAGLTGTTPALGVIPPPTFSPSSVPMPAAQRRATAAPAPAPMPSPTPAMGIPARRPTAAPAVGATGAEHALTEPALPATPPPAAKAHMPRRSPSAARRAETELTDAMREALAAWADNPHPDSNPNAKKSAAMGEKAKRSPAPSAYLNSSPPAKRGRKKTDTQDWLC